jgi:hypothetical protein
MSRLSPLKGRRRSFTNEPVLGCGEAFAAFSVEGGSRDLEGSELFDLGEHFSGTIGVFLSEVTFLLRIGGEIVELQGEVVGIEGVAFDDEFPGAKVQRG